MEIPKPSASPKASADPLAEFFFRPDERAAGLSDLAPDAEEKDAAAEEPLREYLGFELSQENYAIALEKVREIVKVLLITEVPRAPADILGVMSVRGEVMPVFDLRRRLRLPPPARPPGRKARVVIVDAGEGPVGLLVDAVEQVVRLRASTIEPPPSGLAAGLEADYLLGIGRFEGRLFVLLNLSAVLARVAPARAGGAR